MDFTSWKYRHLLSKEETDRLDKFLNQRKTEEECDDLRLIRKNEGAIERLIEALTEENANSRGHRNRKKKQD